MCIVLQVNIFMGIGLLSMPYAMSQSGWLGMVALGIATAVFCISGKLIVRNFEKMPADVAHTYPALGMPPFLSLIFCLTSWCDVSTKAVHSLLVEGRQILLAPTHAHVLRKS